MTDANTCTLIDKQNGNLAFRVLTFEGNSHFDHIQRLNYYSLIWIRKGSGTVKADFSEYPFLTDVLFAFSPYQPFMLQANERLEGVVLNFHPDFFCIHKHHQEVACNGVLFNNIYAPPFIAVDEGSSNVFLKLLEQIKSEIQHAALAQYEVLISYLKIFLITASRLKSQHELHSQTNSSSSQEPFILQSLKSYIDTHFKTIHSPSDYAGLLNISTKSLAKITKAYFNKTLTDLISERIIIEAKRELYLTNKTVKEIAFDLGYEDEYYFSRFFKKSAAISPQMYRDTVGFGKAMAL